MTPETPGSDSAANTVKVWDAPTRVFHWLLVLSFAVAYLTAEGERWRLVHVTFGYTFGALLVFRLLWGFVGTRYARWNSFVRGPAAVLRYLAGLKAGKPEHYLGHNPAGAVAIVLMVALGLGQLVSGWAVYNDLAGEWLSGVHELLGNTMLVLIAAHLAGVVSGSIVHRENLVRAMVTGNKTGLSGDGISNTWRLLAVAILLAALLFWAWQWHTAPV